MNYRLLYDVAQHSDAPRDAAVFGFGIGFLVLISIGVLYLRGLPIGSMVKFFSAVSVLMILLSGLMLYEKHWIARKLLTEGKTLEGFVVGHWQSWERREPGSRSYWDYEGFYVNGVHFSYTRNVQGNYFNNGSGDKFEIKDGMLVRIKYLVQKQGGVTRNNIARFEWVETPTVTQLTR